MLERLQKIIARAGVASRRHAEEMITSGLVTLNGKTVTELGTKADETKDHIKVSGKLLRPVEERISLIFNKPTEVIATMSDPEGRQSIQDFLHGLPQRVFPVGRLEYHASGLVFLTNDGELGNRVLKAQRLRKTYQLKLKTLLTFAEIEKLSRLTGARISRLRGKDSPWYEVTLTEPRDDVLRDKLFQTGHPVEKIRRISIGSLELGRLEPGQYRLLSPAELSAFAKSLDGVITDRGGPKKPKRPAKSFHGSGRHGSGSYGAPQATFRPSKSKGPRKDSARKSKPRSGSDSRKPRR